MPRLSAAVLLALLVAMSMVLSGCHVLDDDGGNGTVPTGDDTDDGADGTGDGTAENNTTADDGSGGDTADEGSDERPFKPTVTIESYTASVSVGEAINVTWNVTFDDPDATDTTPHTALHWADFSVSDPSAPADYGNTSALKEDVALPDSFDGDFSVDFNGTLYLRAHLIYDGAHHWSDEVTIEVAPGASGGTVQTVSISALAVCSEADYDPDPVEIKVGDSIQWKNGDGTFDCAHTATSDDDAGYDFDTGDIPKGATSDPIVFTEAGEFPYHCKYHPSMAGTVKVTA